MSAENKRGHDTVPDAYKINSLDGAKNAGRPGTGLLSSGQLSNEMVWYSDDGTPSGSAPVHAFDERSSDASAVAPIDHRSYGSGPVNKLPASDKYCSEVKPFKKPFENVPANLLCAILTLRMPAGKFSCIHLPTSDEPALNEMLLVDTSTVSN